jgi:hypothetical protein
MLCGYVVPGYVVPVHDFLKLCLSMMIVARTNPPGFPKSGQARLCLSMIFTP